MAQIELIFGSHDRAHTYIAALKTAGAPVTVDTCHYVKCAGCNGAAECARPDFSYQGGSRALGLL
jgi:hypothetical protein